MVVAVRYVKNQNKQEAKKIEKQEQADFFDDKISIKRSSFLNIKNSPLINPELSTDYALLFWFQSKILPEDGGRIPVLYKFKNSKSAGFALSLSNNNGTIRPEMYWNNDKNEGRWFSFTEIPIKKSRWNAFLISFREGKYLGLHYFSLSKKKGAEVVNLGGYELENIVASSNSDLKIGSVGNKAFYGSLGKITAFKAEKNEYDLSNLISYIENNPFYELEDLKDFKPVFYVDSNIKDLAGEVKVKLRSPKKR